jgi:hypothetical protein
MLLWFRNPKFAKSARKLVNKQNRKMIPTKQETIAIFAVMDKHFTGLYENHYLAP